MAHKFEIYKDKAGEFRVRFKYNSEIIFSTEGYSDKSGAKRAVEAIKKHVGGAETVEPPDRPVPVACGQPGPARRQSDGTGPQWR